MSGANIVYIYSFYSELQSQYIESLLKSDCIRVRETNTSAFRPNYSVSVNTSKGEVDIVIYVDQVSPALVKDSLVVELVDGRVQVGPMDCLTRCLQKDNNLLLNIISNDTNWSSGRLLWETLPNAGGQVLLEVVKNVLGSNVSLVEYANSTSTYSIIDSLIKTNKSHLTREELVVLIDNLFV